MKSLDKDYDERVKVKESTMVLQGGNISWYHLAVAIMAHHKLLGTLDIHWLYVLSPWLVMVWGRAVVIMTVLFFQFIKDWKNDKEEE